MLAPSVRLCMHFKAPQVLGVLNRLLRPHDAGSRYFISFKRNELRYSNKIRRTEDPPATIEACHLVQFMAFVTPCF